MLGNFSFQDYFKDEVIPWAWEFLTSDEWMAIPKDKLYISVYLDDDEAYDIWTQKVGIAPDHMVRMGKEDNFWEHGSGPLRPLLRDLLRPRPPSTAAASPPAVPAATATAIWRSGTWCSASSIRTARATMSVCPSPNIDTGMGPGASGLRDAGGGQPV